MARRKRFHPDGDLPHFSLKYLLGCLTLCLDLLNDLEQSDGIIMKTLTSTEKGLTFVDVMRQHPIDLTP
jgi:hypothetical protein